MTHVYNEEYLLPFWLNHHKDMFDEIIVIDYRSTDKSVEICKQICPTCKVITTRNRYFEAIETDKEVMYIEKDTEGIKIVLNTTEFLFSSVPIRGLFTADNPICYDIKVTTPYSNKQYEFNNNYELFSGLLNEDVVYHKNRLSRFLHNFPTGNYSVGRHSTHNPTTKNNNIQVVWFGYYPFNENTLIRKLQIQNNIPQSDKEKGLGIHYFKGRDSLIKYNENAAETGAKLQNINLELYNILHKKLKTRPLMLPGGMRFYRFSYQTTPQAPGRRLRRISNYHRGNNNDMVHLHERSHKTPNFVILSLQQILYFWKSINRIKEVHIIFKCLDIYS